MSVIKNYQIIEIIRLSSLLRFNINEVFHFYMRNFSNLFIIFDTSFNNVIINF